MAFGSLIQHKHLALAASGVMTQAMTFDVTPTAGNLLIATIHSRGNSYGPAAPTGWTFLGLNNSSNATVQTFAKVSDGAEGSFTVGWTSDPVNTDILIAEYEGPFPALGWASLENVKLTTATVNSQAIALTEALPVGNMLVLVPTTIRTASTLGNITLSDGFSAAPVNTLQTGSTVQGTHLRKVVTAGGTATVTFSDDNVTGTNLAMHIFAFYGFEAEETIFTDFQDETVGALPAFTAANALRHGDPNRLAVWEIQDNSGDKVLTMPTAVAAGWGNAVLNPFKQWIDDGEIYGEGSSTSSLGESLILSAVAKPLSGSWWPGYFCDINEAAGDEIRLRTINSGGGAATKASAALGFTHTPGDMIKMVMRIDGFRVRCKAWPAADAEPSTWQIDFTDSSYALRPLNFGVSTDGDTSNLQVTWKTLGVGVNGSSAPRTMAGEIHSFSGALVGYPSDVAATLTWTARNPEHLFSGDLVGSKSQVSGSLTRTAPVVTIVASGPTVMITAGEQDSSTLSSSAPVIGVS